MVYKELRFTVNCWFLGSRFLILARQTQTRHGARLQGHESKDEVPALDKYLLLMIKGVMMFGIHQIQDCVLSCLVKMQLHEKNK